MPDNEKKMLDAGNPPSTEDGGGVEPSFMKPRGRRTRFAAIFAGFIALAAVILVAVNFSDISAFADQAARAQPSWLLFAAVSQTATYLCVALVWRLVLKRMDYPLPLMTLFPLSVAKLFADQALPSGGVSGAAFFLFALNRRNVPQKPAFCAFAFVTIAFFFAFLIASVISLAALSAAKDAPPALDASVSIFSAIFIFLTAAAFLFFVYKPKDTPGWILKIPGAAKVAEMIGAAANDIAHRPGLFAQATLIQFGVRMIDGFTLWLVFFAIADTVPFGVCFIAVVIASIAATIGPMPMGLGAFEGGMIASLAVFGVAAEDALTATLIYRGLSLWLPLIPGFFIIQREALREKAAAVNRQN